MPLHRPVICQRKEGVKRINDTLSTETYIQTNGMTDGVNGPVFSFSEAIPKMCKSLLLFISNQN